MEEEQLDTTKLKYVLYARKSTTDETRQVRSIGDQIADCLLFAKRNGLTVVNAGKPLMETKSAKTPNQRPVYNKMLEDIKAGKYDGILAWNPDRLARNMLEGGQLIDMIDNNVIKDLKFVTHHFTRDANGKMLLGMAFVLSKQYSDDLSQKVTRGVRGSLTEGKSPIPKHGYIRNEQTGYYEPDGKNFILMKDGWKIRLQGHSLDAIAEYMNSHSYGRIVKKSGRLVKMDKRILSDIFHDPFYYGILVQADGKVDLREKYDFVPMVSEDDYLLIQQKYYKSSLPHKRKRTTFYPFKRMIFCSYCKQLMVVAPSQSGSGGRLLYARCDTEDCPRPKKSIRINILLSFIYELLEQGLNLTEKEYEQYYQDITGVLEQERTKKQIELHSKQSLLSATNQEIKERGLAIVGKSMSATVSKVNEDRIAELDEKKESLQREIAVLRDELADPEKEKLTAEQFLNLSKEAANIVKSGDAVQKDTICRFIFLNFLVNEEKVLDYQAKEPFATLL